MTTETQTKERLTLWVDKEIKKQAKSLAIMAGTSVSNLFEQLVERTKQHEEKI